MEVPILATLAVFAGLMFMVLVVQPWILQLSTAMGGNKVVSWGRAAICVILATVANLIVGCGLGLTGVGAFVSWIIGLFVWAALISTVLEVEFGRSMIVGMLMTLFNWGLMLLVLFLSGITLMGTAAMSGAFN